VDERLNGIEDIHGIVCHLGKAAVVLFVDDGILRNLYLPSRLQVETDEPGLRMATGEIDEIRPLTTAEFQDKITVLDVLRDGIRLFIYILIGKAPVLGNPEVHETVMRVIVPVSPMVDSVIRTDLFHGVLVALNVFLEVEELRHIVYLGMKLIKTIPCIHLVIILK
jgi:hypothetical protein